MRIRTIIMLTLAFAAASILAACQTREVAPVPKNPDIGPPGYCERGADGLRVTVSNGGTAVETDIPVSVEFGTLNGPVDVPGTISGDVQPGATGFVDVAIPPLCFIPDCDFTITVDPDNKIPESDENNNTAQGKCIG